MDISKKISILAEAARYDASCASSGSGGRAETCRLGNTSTGGICHSWSDDGRCISLLKLLMTNHCIYDCAYCLNRRSSDIPRAAFTPDEIVGLASSFYRRNYIEGLFLSSGVMVSPDHTMERMMEVAFKLRRDEGFGGYIHMKTIPGASPELIRKAGLLADRISVNIELPSEDSLRRLAPEKNRRSILGPMSQIGSAICENRAERRKTRKAPRFAPAGQSTQMIIGASPESDRQILGLSKSLYDKFMLKRVYYSAYMPVGKDFLSTTAPAPLLREHRLYQADWLLRFYGFDTEEITPPSSPFLDDKLDPKCSWALRNPHVFPVDVNSAEENMLLRVPGIGPSGARKILGSRRFARLRYEDLARFGIAMKRARHFISCDGYHVAGFERRINGIREILLGQEAENVKYLEPDLPLE